MRKKSVVALFLIIILTGSLTSCILQISRGEPTPEPEQVAVATFTPQPLPATSTPMPAPPTETPLPPTDTPVPTPAATDTPLPPTIRVTADILNARSEPNTDSEIIMKLEQGTMLPVLGRNIVGDWVMIALSDGQEAWISAEWVESTVPLETLAVKEEAPPTPTPLPATATPTEAPTTEASPTPFRAPVLVSPAHEQVFDGRGPQQLTWEWAGTLASNQYFVVTIAYPHEGAVWHDVHWVKERTFAPPSYLKDLITNDRRCQWNVTVMRQTGTASDGAKVGEPISGTSETRSFVWGS
jgi:hypothetical protein